MKLLEGLALAFGVVAVIIRNPAVAVAFFFAWSGGSSQRY
jgi:hypothetical protein